MPLARKNGRILNIKLDEKIYELLEKHSEQTKLTKTAIVELALESYINAENRHGNK